MIIKIKFLPSVKKPNTSKIKQVGVSKTNDHYYSVNLPILINYSKIRFQIISFDNLCITKQKIVFD